MGFVSDGGNISFVTALPLLNFVLIVFQYSLVYGFFTSYFLFSMLAWNVAWFQELKTELLRACGDNNNWEKIVQTVNDSYYMKEYFMNESRYKNGIITISIYIKWNPAL